MRVPLSPNILWVTSIRTGPYNAFCPIPNRVLIDNVTVKYLFALSHFPNKCFGVGFMYFFNEIV